MKFFSYKLVSAFLAIAVLALLVTGCNKTSTSTATTTTTPSPTTSKTPPQIPPLQTFLMPLDDFTSGAGISSAIDQESQREFVCLASSDSMPLAIQQAALIDQSNWLYAASKVLFWRTVAVVGLAIPVAAFKASFVNTPVQQTDGSWIWSYTVTVIGTYTAKLHGSYTDNGVHWEMNISKQGEYTDFLWYYGDSDLPATHGSWTLKENPQSPNDLLRIDWQRNIADGTYTVQYTNIKPGAAENGGYISVQYTGQTPYNHIWDIYNKAQDNHVNIEWNNQSQAGEIKDYSKYFDNNWHCWDTSHNNCACQ